MIFLICLVFGCKKHEKANDISDVFCFLEQKMKKPMIFLRILVFLSKKKRENANDISDIFGFLEQKLGFILLF